MQVGRNEVVESQMGDLSCLLVVWPLFKLCRVHVCVQTVSVLECMRNGKKRKKEKKNTTTPMHQQS